jgi:hypothetical protein
MREALLRGVDEAGLDRPTAHGPVASSMTRKGLVSAPWSQYAATFSCLMRLSFRFPGGSPGSKPR